MDLISLKYWHWMVLGIIMGGLVGYAWTGFEPTMPRSGNALEFKRWVGQASETEANKGKPKIFDIVVMAPEVDPNNKTVYPVVYKLLGTKRGTNPPESAYVEQCLYTDEKFDGGDSIRAFLDKKGVSYSDRSGAGKYLPVGYGVAAGMLGVGLIWPTMIRMLVGAGLAKPKPVEEKTYATGEQDDGTVKPKKRFGFGGFGGGEKTADPLAAKPAAPAGEESIDGLFQSSAPSRGGSKRPAESAPPEPTEAEKKEYGGVYYPVARPGTGKKDA